MLSTESQSSGQKPGFPVSVPGRSVERRLIFLISLISAVGIYILKQNLPRSAGCDPVVAGSIIVLSFWLLHVFLVFRKEKGDELFIPLAAFLVILGWLEIYRLSPVLAYKQLYWILIGEFVFIIWMIFVKDYRALEDYKYICLVGAIILQGSLAFFGHEVNGAKLWFRFPFFSIQPVEFIKILLTIFLASYLKQNREILEKPLDGKGNSVLVKYYVLLFILWGTAESVLIAQKDLGMSLLLFGVFIGLFYVTTRKSHLTIAGIAVFTAASIILYKVFPHVRLRINNWLNPWHDPEGTGFQVIQSLYALANGGLLGAGLGSGEPYLIPAVQTDLIFVALGEELGLVGALIILGVFLVLIERMFRAAACINDEFSAFLSLGLALMFATQVFIIVGGAVNLIPLTGITLPFVSYGGSSLVSNFILLSLFLQITGKIESDADAAQVITSSNPHGGDSDA